MSSVVEKIIKSMEGQIDGLLLSLVILRRERLLTEEEKNHFVDEIRNLEKTIRALREGK